MKLAILAATVASAAALAPQPIQVDNFSAGCTAFSSLCHYSFDIQSLQPENIVVCSAYTSSDDPELSSVENVECEDSSFQFDVNTTASNLLLTVYHTPKPGKLTVYSGDVEKGLSLKREEGVDVQQYTGPPVIPMRVILAIDQGRVNGL